MSQVVLDSYRCKISALASEINEYSKDDHDVVLVVGEDASPEKIMKIIAASIGGFDVKVVVRHAELAEYFEHAATAGAIGAGVGVLAVLCKAIAADNPATLGAMLAAAGVGAMIGAIVGAGSTPLAQVRIYKANGQTRIKFVADA